MEWEPSSDGLLARAPEAIRQGDVDSLRRLLQSGLPLHAANDEGVKLGSSLLLLAAEAGQLDCAQELLAAGVAPAAPGGFDGDTPLHAAARLGQLAVLRLLLAQPGPGPDVGAGGELGGGAPLHAAAAAGQAGAVRLLLEFGAQVDCHDLSRQTPLHLAAISGKPECARSLLTAGACPAAEDESQATPLHLAASRGCEEVVRLLLEAGASASHSDRSGQTPLHCAVQAGRPAVAQALLGLGAEVMAASASGHTAFWFVVDRWDDRRAGEYGASAAALLAAVADPTLRSQLASQMLGWAGSRGIRVQLEKAIAGAPG